MAAPLVSGCAALVRQYYRQERGVEPSAALLKATLVNSTRWLSGPDATAEHAKNPNFHQGFGAVHMPFAIPNPGEPWLRLEFVDTWKDAGKQLSETGDRRRFAFTVNGGQFLRICLAWTDPPPGPVAERTGGDPGDAAQPAEDRRQQRAPAADGPQWTGTTTCRSCASTTRRRATT